MPMQTFSTDAVRDAERFDYLDSFVRGQFFDMTIEVSPELQPGLRAEATICACREAVMVEFDTTAVAFDRDKRDISRQPSGTFLLCKSVQGSAAFQSDGDPFVCQPGDLSMGSADLAFRSTIISGRDHRFRLLALPEQRLDRTMAANRSLPLQPIGPTHGIHALLSNYYDAVWLEMGHLSPAEETIAIETIVQLLAVARGTLSAEHDAGREGIRAARLQLVRDHIEANLRDGRLSPATTARAMHISVRQLHLLFEPTGTSFTRYVQSRRLDRARVRLLANSSEPVIAVAYATGFESLTTFNRAFRLAFGASPTELRRSGAN